MLPLIKKLVTALNEHVIEYCHWKSNCRLKDALSGKTDLDLLVNRKSVKTFELILQGMGFRVANTPAWDRHHSIKHFYGYDDESGQIVHVHAYYKIVTGGSLIKNYRLPLEEMLFKNTYIIDNIRIPKKGAELLIFVLRKGLEAFSIIEYAFMYKEDISIEKELAWLHTPESEKEAIEIFNQW